MAVSHAFTNNVPDATGTLSVWFGATTATVAASDIVKPSDWNSAHVQVMTLGGNTAGVSTVSGTNIVFGGSNNVTLSGIQGANAATINFSAAAGGGGGSVNLSAGTTSNNLTNFVFADGNGVSFGLNGSTVTATVRTNQAGTGFTSTTTAGTAVAATLSTNGLSMAVPQFLTTAQPVGAYLTTARASNDAVGLNTAQTNVTWTVNSAGLSLNAAGYAGTGTTFNGANVSGSMTVNSNGVNLSLSAGAGGGGTNLTAYANSNTTQSSSGTIALSSLNFAGAGIASVGITNGSVLISVPSGGGAGDGGVSAGVSNLGNTAGSTGIQTAGNFVLVGSNGITLSQSTGAGNATVTIQGAPAATFYEPFYWASNATALVTLSQSTSNMQPFRAPFLNCSFARLWATFATNSTSVATTANTSFSVSKLSTINMVAYSLGTGASSRSLISVASGSAGFSQQWSIGANSTGSQYTVTMNITYPVTGGTSSYSTSYATSQTRFDFSSNSITLFSGSRFFDVPFSATLTEGQYWMAIGMSTNTSTQGVAAMSNAGFVLSQFYHGANGVSAVAAVGEPSNVTLHFQRPGQGTFTVAGGGTTSAFPIVTNSLSAFPAVPYFQLRAF